MDKRKITIQEVLGYFKLDEQSHEFNQLFNNINNMEFNAIRFDILQSISSEREKQDLKFGEQNHSPIEWCAILGEEVGEVNKADLEAHFGFADKSKSLEEYKKELIQVAAVAVAMLESLERNELKSTIV